MFRRFLVCVAFASFCFFRTWVELGQGLSTYFDRYVPLHSLVLPVLCCEALLALALFAAWELCRRLGWQNRLPVHFLFLLVSLVALRGAYLGTYRLAGKILPVHAPPIVHNRYLWAVIAIVGLSYALSHARRVSHLLLAGFRYSLPALFVVYLWAGYAVLRYPASAYADGTPAPQLARPHSPLRVVWVVFDEMSQSLAFGHRPQGLFLPNFDRLKAESFYATAAEPPSGETITSLPSLTLGEIIVKAEPRGPDRIMLWKQGAAGPFSWRSAPNVFDSARALGFNTALAGWYHPYGRLLNRSLTRSYWTTAWFPNGTEEPAYPLSLTDALRYRWRGMAMFLLAGQQGNDATVATTRDEMARRFSSLIDRAVQFAADPSLGLALLHLPVPHPPTLFSRSKGAMETEGRMSYLDNLALADRTLGTLRQAMEKAKLWDTTAVLVSSDHGWRPQLWRPYREWTAEDEAAAQIDTTGVPFLLKLPASHASMEYGQPFNTVITRVIISSILNGSLRSIAEVPALIGGAADKPGN